MRDSQPARFVSSLILIGALGFLFLYFVPFPPRPDARLHEALGQVLSEEASRLLGPEGRVVVIVRDTTEFDSPATQMQLRSFRRSQKQAGQRVAMTRLIRKDVLRPVVVPPGDFYELLRRTGSNDVIVSFMGPPDLTEAQRLQLGGGRARVAALCTGSTPAQVDLRQLFNCDLLHAAVLSRRGAARTTFEPSTVRGWFDLSFQLVTATNLSDLPAPVTANP